MGEKQKVLFARFSISIKALPLENGSIAEKMKLNKRSAPKNSQNQLKKLDKRLYKKSYKTAYNSIAETPLYQSLRSIVLETTPASTNKVCPIPAV